MSKISSVSNTLGYGVAMWLLGCCGRLLWCCYSFAGVFQDIIVFLYCCWCVVGHYSVPILLLVCCGGLMDRASDLKPEGCGFESQVRQGLLVGGVNVQLSLHPQYHD